MNLNKFIAKRNNIVFYTSNDIGVKPILSKINEDMNFYKNTVISRRLQGQASILNSTNVSYFFELMFIPTTIIAALTSLYHLIACGCYLP